MQCILKFLIKIVIIVVIFAVLAIIILLFAVEYLNEFDVTQQPLPRLCILWNSLRATVLNNRTSMIQGIVVGIIVGVILWWVRRLYDKIYSPRYIQKAHFPFICIEANQLLKIIPDFPSLEVPYIQREDEEIAEALINLGTPYLFN